LAQFYQLGGDLEGAKLEWLLVTEIHEGQGDFERAVRSLERALELAPDEMEWRLRLSRIRSTRLGESELALRELRALFKARPDWQDSTRAYLELLEELGRMVELGEALAVLQALDAEDPLAASVLQAMRERMESRPLDLTVRLGWGELCYGLGALDLAIEQFQKLRRHSQHRLDSYRLLGLCFARKKGFNMLELALSQFRKGLALEDQCPRDTVRLRYDLAGVLAEFGRTSEALQEYRICQELEPQMFDVAQRIASLESR